jgi:hypothetical protein
MTKQEADFIGSMNMCDEISNEAYKKIMCNCEVEESQPCEDCISREALDNAISDLTYWHFENDRLVTGGGGSKTETVYKVDDVWRLTHVLPSVAPQPKTGEWILCDTQLPPKDKNVLVTRMYKGKPYVEIAEWNDGWTSYSDEYKVDYFTEHQVVAWMPLPKPFQPPTMMCEED